MEIEDTVRYLTQYESNIKITKYNSVDVTYRAIYYALKLSSCDTENCGIFYAEVLFQEYITVLDQHAPSLNEIVI